MENKTGKSTSKTTKRVTANNPFSAILGGKTSGDTGAKKRTTASRTTTSSRKKTVFSASAAKAATAVKTAISTAAAVSAVKVAKKPKGRTMPVAVICFILAFIIGAGVCFFAGKDDYFEIVGEEQIYIEQNARYSDEGVKIREFGLDLSNRAVVETDLKKDENGDFYADEAGDYYIMYTVKSLKFGFIYPVKKIRIVSVVGDSEGGF